MAREEGKINILLVDDRPDGLLSMEAVLQASGYNLIKAASGREALGCLLNEDFAVILLDVQMPDLDGLETAAIIKSRERSKNIPIIFITAVSQDDSFVYRAYETGAVDYIFKPFDPNILRSKVAVFVSIYKQNLEIKRQAEILKQNERIQREQALARLELESLQRYRDLADALPNIVWRADADGTLNYFNHVWCDYTGLSLEQSSGTGWRPMLHDEDLRNFLQIWEDRMSSGDSFDLECRIKGRDGSYRWHLIRTVAEKSRSGRIIGWISSSNDTHDRRQAEDQMRKAGEVAVEASRLKSEFLHNMSHEIRTPINGIMGMTDLLLGTPLSDEQRGFVKTVHESSNILLSIVNDVLDFAKIEAGRMDLENIDFLTRSVVESPCQLMEAKASQKNLSLMTFIAPDVPPLLQGDPGRLGQIVLNLLGNALKFTNHGSVAARVTLEPLADGSSNSGLVTLRFSVSDTGIGLSETARRRLFQPFVQADGSTARKYGGTGLGLSICKTLVELMGGKIGVDSEEGKGSTFWFTVCLEKGTGLELLESSADLMADSKGDLKDLRTLVVDDDSDLLEIMHIYLSSWGVRNETVSTGVEALKILSRRVAEQVPVDLVLIDRFMPGMDGFMLARAIRSNPLLTKTRLILVTGGYTNTLGEQVSAEGFDGFLLKPFKQSTLFNCLVDQIKKSGSPPTGAVEHGAESGATTTPNDPALSKKGKLILVAEDNTVNQTVTLKQLTKLGYTAHVVADGRKVIEALSRLPYDLVLMDCQMPEMDGFEATRAIREMKSAPWHRIPIIALTAHAMKEDEEKCLAAGMDDYISKPINIKALGAMIEKWLSRKGELRKAS